MFWRKKCNILAKFHNTDIFKISMVILKQGNPCLMLKKYNNFCLISCWHKDKLKTINISGILIRAWHVGANAQLQLLFENSISKIVWFFFFFFFFLKILSKKI